MLTTHIGKKAACKLHYGTRFDEMKKIGKEELKKRNREYQQRHKKKIGKEEDNKRKRENNQNYRKKIGKEKERKKRSTHLYSSAASDEYKRKVSWLTMMEHCIRVN